MPSAGFAPIGIEKFGGLATFVDPTNLPNYSSPDCSDVEFVEGLVRTRPSFLSQFPVLSSNPSINYLKTFVTANLGLRMYTLDALGNVYVENPQGTLTLVATPVFGAATTANSYGNSVSLFTREYLAMGDGKFGLRRPLQMNDQFIDMVTQSGPGKAPSVTDENISVGIAASATGLQILTTVTIATISENNFVVTVTMTGVVGDIRNFMQIGDAVTIAGVTPAGYNGSFQISALTGVETFQYINSTNGLASAAAGSASFGTVTLNTTSSITMKTGQLISVAGATNAAFDVIYAVRLGGTGTSFHIYSAAVVGLTSSGGGTASFAGSVVAGTHQVSVFYQDREGYLTRPAPPASWLSAGNKRAVVTNIPLPPGTVAGQLSNIVARILCFTTVDADSFFYQDGSAPVFSGNMIINDITTTTVTVDFSDETLLEGTNVDDLFDLVELGACAGVTEYNSRLFWWGERTKLDNLINLGFEGGGSDPTVPGGWTVDPTFGAGGIVTTEAVVETGYLGAFYHVQGTGAAKLGLITQTLYQDYLGTPILSPQTAYSIRAVVQSTAQLGTLHINAFSASGGINTTGITFAGNQPATEIIAPLVGPLTTIPSDLVLQIYADSSPGLFDVFKVYNIEIFPTNNPYNVTVVRVSKVPADIFAPESYSGVDGFLNVAPDNGQAVRSCFVIRNNLYMVKERSLYVTQDNGQEPATWSIQNVSSKVGTLSVRGVGLGDEWAIIAAQDGVYYFDGSLPQKISQEIQPTWNQINWAFGHLVNVTVDIQRKRVYILAPFGISTIPNRMITLDYADGFGDPTPTSTVNIAGIGRKWSPWSVSGNSMALILRTDGTMPLFLGNNTGTGKIYALDPTLWSPSNTFSDDGVPITSYWQSGYFQDVGRMDFGYISADIVGSGLCSLILRKGDQGWITNVRGWNLSPLGFHNVERNIGSIVAERLSVRVGTVGTGFSLQGLAMWQKSAAWSPTRGVNF